MSRKKYALLMTVGTGVGSNREKAVNSLSKGLLYSIELRRPDLICFFASDDSMATVNSIKNIYSEEEIDYNKDYSKIDENQKTPFDEDYKNEIVKFVDVDNFDELLGKFKSKILELKDDYNIGIDYTSGTKTMTMAAGFSSMLFGYELFIVGGRRKNGVVIHGTEENKTQNLYQVYDDLKIKEIKHLFDIHQFDAGKVLIAELTNANKYKEAFFKLFDAYYYFDSVDHEKALETFENNEFKKYWPDLTKQFKLNIKALNIINNENHNQKKYYVLASILNNSKRRASENKFDDAVARLYRSLELIAQIKLFDEYGINSSDVDVDILRQKGLNDGYLNELEIMRDKESGKIKSGLTRDYILLVKLGDDLGKFYTQNENKIKNVIKFRNNSILAHGFGSCSKKEYDEFSKITLDAAYLLHKDMDSFMDETAFPNLS